LQTQPNVLEKALFGVIWRQLPKLVPGVILALVVTLVSKWLAGFIGRDLMGFAKSPVSSIMVAILLGLLLRNTLGVPDLFRPGMTFCLKKLLRLGIILLGVRLSLVDLLRISVSALPIIVLLVGSALFLGLALARRLHLPERLGILTAVGTSICGVSAIVATAPCINASEEEVSYAVANITLFGLLATFIYPFLAHTLLGSQPLSAGLFLGTAIHDTAQATGAGLIYDSNYGVTSSPSVGEVAVVAKLVRNALMTIAIPLVSWIYARRINDDPQCRGKRGTFWQYFPQFVIGFTVLALVRTVGDAMLNSGNLALGLMNNSSWSATTGAMASWAKDLLILAMASVGLNTSVRLLKGLGLRPLLLGLVSAALVGGISFILLSLFGDLLVA